MDRKDKIALLKGIANGTRSIKEMMPVQVKIWHEQDGIYRTLDSNLQLTKEEFLEHTAKKNKTIHFLGGAITDVIVVHSYKDETL